jgi:type II secretory pathway pseudopilin PulG
MNRKPQGFALIDLIFVCGIIGLLAGIAVPRLTLAKSAAGSASAIGTLRSINSAQLTFALTCGAGFYAPNLTTLGIAPPGSHEPFIAAGLGDADTVIKSGYVIKVEATGFAGAPSSCNGLGGGEAGQGFKAGADPADSLNSRHFATNANNAIYEDTTSLYMTMPESGEPPDGHPLR